LNDAKIVVACRVLPELKAELEDEAAERGESLSSYMDFLINHREHIFDESDDEILGEARDYIAQLEREKATLSNEVNKLNQRITITSKESNEKIPITFTDSFKKALIANLERLCQKHTDYSPEQLLLASTGLALENGTFTVYNLKDFLKKFNHLYNLNNKEATR
jgi:hypothetical protein